MQAVYRDFFARDPYKRIMTRFYGCPCVRRSAYLISDNTGLDCTVLVLWIYAKGEFSQYSCQKSIISTLHKVQIKLYQLSKQQQKRKPRGTKKLVHRIKYRSDYDLQILIRF
jgi:hypothetical protein